MTVLKNKTNYFIKYFLIFIFYKNYEFFIFLRKLIININL